MRSITRPANRALLAMGFSCLAYATCGYAADIAIHVVDGDGHAVAQLVVTARPRPDVQAPALEGSAAGSELHVVQQFQTFAPAVLPVAVGTTVSFPNLDRMRHHVYSFSEAKRFEIRLYSGEQVPEVRFDAPGIVVIGCNIHDWMEAYVYVTDAPYFAVADAAGQVSLLGLPEGDYDLSFWHPTLDAAIDLEHAVTAGGAAVSYEFAHSIAPLDQSRPQDSLLSKFRHAGQ